MGNSQDFRFLTFNGYISQNSRAATIDELIKRLKPYIKADANVRDLGFSSPEVKLSIPIPSCSLLQRNKHLEELNNKLNQY